MSKIDIINEAIFLMLILECGISSFAIFSTFKLKRPKEYKFKLITIFLIPFLCLLFSVIIKKDNFEYSAIMTLQTLMFYSFVVLYYRAIQNFNRRFDDTYEIINFISNFNNDIICIVDKQLNKISFTNKNINKIIKKDKKQCDINDCNFDDLLNMIEDDELKEKLFDIRYDKTTDEITIKPCDFETTKKFYVYKKAIISKCTHRSFDIFIISVLTDDMFDVYFYKLSCDRRKDFIKFLERFLECRKCEK